MAAVQSTCPSEGSSLHSQVTTLTDCLSLLPHNEPAAGTVVASRCVSKQPTATELAKYNIKVRDFAFESTLPPIAPVYLHPKQIQPNPTMLRPGQDNSTQPSNQSDDGRKLEKHPTQSLTQPVGVTRKRGFMDLRDYDTDNDELPESQDSICTVLQLPSSYTQSQESDEYVKTPIVTPNGSLQWQDVDGSDLPASQLDNLVLLRPQPLLQTPTRTETVHKDVAPMTPSPLSSANSSFCLSPSPMPGSKTLLHRYRLRTQSSHTIRTRASHLTKDATPPPITTCPASRYYLRKRSNNAAPPPTSRPATRSRLGQAGSIP